MVRMGAQLQTGAKRESLSLHLEPCKAFPSSGIESRPFLPRASLTGPGSGVPLPLLLPFLLPLYSCSGTWALTHPDSKPFFPGLLIHPLPNLL